MPAPATADDFLNVARKCDVLDQQKLEACVRKLQDVGQLPADPRELASRLVDEGVLTRFQREQLLRGKYRGFTLGKYHVLERLGSGGMGTVYLAEHRDMRRRVALKVLTTDRRKDSSIVARFRREARAVGALAHPNIVHALDFNEDGEVLFLVMEYVEGVSLHELVARHGPLAFARAAHYVRQAALGLQHAHESAGIVHRDIKPGNILVDRHGTVKVLDMGLARFFHDEEDILTRKFDAKILGTADYLAPEQALDSHSVDVRADIYGLGATFYFLLTGSPPFPEGTPAQKILAHRLRTPRPVRELRPEVPAELAAVLEKMMAKDPGQRYQTPREVADALLPWTQTPLPPPAEHELRQLSPALMTGVSTGKLPPAATVTGQAAKASPSPSPLPHSDGGAGRVREPAETAVAALRGGRETQHASSPPLPVVQADKVEVVGAGGAQSRNLWIGLAAGAAALLLVGVGVAALGLWFALSPRTRTESGQPAASGGPPPPGPRAPLVVTRAGPKGSHATLGEAWASARPGDVILVEDEVIEESLSLDGTDLANRGVTIRGRTPAGQPVTWRPPADAGKDQALLTVSDVADVRIEGFHFDGQNRVAELIILSGPCPGVVLEDVQCANFLRSAVRLSGCAGSAAQPVTLSRLRLLGGANRESALVFEAAEGRGCEHVRVSNSRLEGPYRAGVQLAGPVADVVFQQNRFARMTDGLRWKKAAPPPALRLTLAGNTFSELERGLHFEAPLSAAAVSGLRLERNLFLQTKKLAFTDGVPTEPTAVEAHWIWFDEGRPLPPSEDRFFRKTFELTAPLPGQAMLDIAGDDTFTVWLNGKEVGRSSAAHFTKRVYSFDVRPYLRPGKNVLAVQAGNCSDLVTGWNTEAGLLVRLSSPAGPLAAAPVISDRSWKAAKKPPAGWLKPDFNDSRWAPVKVLEQYGKGRDGKGFGPWVHLVWDSTVRQHFRGTPPPGPLSVGNFRDQRSSEGYPPLESRGVTLTLPTDPAKDELFLRYPKSSPLFRAGPDGTPVGAAPVD
jgi:serine/threonine protein kinase